MAIAPNTTFVSGAVLTAAQQNSFGFGIVAYQTVIVNDSFTTEEIEITATTFTAIANRYYRIMYFETNLNNNADANVTQTIRLTNLAGAIQGSSFVFCRAGGFSSSGMLIAYSTFAAGSTVLVGTLTSSTGTSTATRTANNKAIISVEDVGPA